MAKPTHVQNTGSAPLHLFGHLVAPRQFVKIPANVNPRDMRRIEASPFATLTDKAAPVTLRGETADLGVVEATLPVLDGRDETKSKSTGRRAAPDGDQPPPPPPPPPTK